MPYLVLIWTEEMEFAKLFWLAKTNHELLKLVCQELVIPEWKLDRFLEMLHTAEMNELVILEMDQGWYSRANPNYDIEELTFVVFDDIDKDLEFRVVLCEGYGDPIEGEEFYLLWNVLSRNRCGILFLFGNQTDFLLQLEWQQNRLIWELIFERANDEVVLESTDDLFYFPKETRRRTITDVDINRYYFDAILLHE